MCTLSFIPTSDKDCIFTTNRDEDPKRIALVPQKYKHDGIELTYPKDSKANGSWMISNGIDTSLCLLNGAFVKHAKRDDYRQSRGLMLIDFFKFPTCQEFIDQFQFEGMEAFTLVVLESKQEVYLTELIWDEHKLHVRKLPPDKAHIWSSSTLYNKEMKIEREQWFWNWLKDETQLESSSVVNFHKTGGSGNFEYGLFMNRQNIVRTVSITQIAISSQAHSMQYFDLLEEEHNTV